MAIYSGFEYLLIFVYNSTWSYKHPTITGLVGVNPPKCWRTPVILLGDETCVLDKTKNLSAPLVPQISSEKLYYKLEHAHNKVSANSSAGLFFLLLRRAR